MSIENDIQENFKRGVLEMLILQLLSSEDMYGYQMKNEIMTRSNNLIFVKEGSLYGPLYRLMSKGYISEKKIKVGLRRERVYYHLESSGLAYLELLIEEYNKMTTGVFNMLQKGTN